MEIMVNVSFEKVVCGYREEVSRQTVMSGQCLDKTICYAIVHQKCMNICKDLGGHVEYSWGEETLLPDDDFTSLFEAMDALEELNTNLKTLNKELDTLAEQLNSEIKDIEPSKPIGEYLFDNDEVEF